MELLKINYLFGWLESHRSAAKIFKKKKKTSRSDWWRGGDRERSRRKKNMMELRRFS